MEFDPLSKEVIGAAIEVHRELGPGLMESVYEKCLAHELRERRICCATQVSMPVAYKGETIDAGYRIDVLVEDCLMIELKSVDELSGLHKAQLLTYMKLARVDTGLLINFNAPVLKDGIRRLVRRGVSAGF
ncbi:MULTISPECIES: GxxExxY protein [unclassified Thioalkalivibrio]|uniref:GxxExxY protein n=1 Tax=unclassified Thioalkalivibrio TaxID=2621013 RepID=UPI0003702358|nr:MULTISPECIES: GxxExxY protein [unclassified Thioalkalivibrio]